jgi:spore coat polysaccharide biosynthesis predicted glycosyltransferase SpsG
MKYKIFIITEGSSEVGLGHLSRILTLIDYLTLDNSLQISLLIKAETAKFLSPTNHLNLETLCR